LRKKKPENVEKKEYAECVVQIRMPAPLPKLQGNFKATDTMRTLYEYIKQNQTQSFAFQIVTPFPRKVYANSDLDTTLAAAELCPRGAVVVEKI